MGILASCYNSLKESSIPHISAQIRETEMNLQIVQNGPNWSISTGNNQLCPTRQFSFLCTGFNYITIRFVQVSFSFSSGLKQSKAGSPGVSVVKDPLAVAGDKGSIPSPLRSHMPQSK